MGNLRVSAEVVRSILSGGSQNVHESKWDIRLIEQILLSARNDLLRADMDNVWRTGVPDQYYTWREFTTEWSETEKAVVVKLGSQPMPLDYDMGLAVTAKGMTLVRAQLGWCAANPYSVWLEGNIAWELRRDVVIFPAASRTMMEGVLVMVGMVDQSPSKEGAEIPSEHEMECQSRALQFLDPSRFRDVVIDANPDNRRSR